MRRGAGWISGGIVLAFLGVAGCSSPTTSGETDGGGADDGVARDGASADGSGGTDTSLCPGAADGDHDGHASTACGGDDCDDTDATRHPGAPETCDGAGADEDCDPTTLGERDADGDGFDDHACCNGTRCGDDCDDQAPGTHPTASEVCNGHDDDCDAATDEGVQVTYFADCDGDGLGAGAGMLLCAPSTCAGFPAVTSSSDCDDARPEAHPGASETCNGLDDDCDATVDEDIPSAFYADCDGDGYGAGAAITDCTPAPCMGHPAVTSPSDCDDAHASAHPGGVETCNAVDDDCSGTADDAGANASCPVIANGIQACIAGVCGVGSCESGRHACGTFCVLDTAVATCGARCAPCPVPIPHASATCDGVGCGVVCDRDFSMIGGTCDVPAPRPVSPMSTSMATSLRPTFRWALAPGSTGARVELCSDRACTHVVLTLDGVGTSTRPTSDLAHGRYFWRLRGAQNGTRGDTTSPVWELDVPARTTAVDSAWGTTPDVNGDGYSDVLVGAQGTANTAGRVYVFHGGAMGIGAAATLTLAAPDDGQFGYDVASAGDVDGDGFSDLVVGAPGAAGGLGAAYVYLGSATGIATTPARTLTGPSAGSRFGESVAGIGDIDRDGYGDVVVGARGVDGSIIGAPSGRAYVYRGSPSGTSSTAIVLTPGAGVTRLGAWVETAGDVDGDGFADLAIGSSNGIFVYAGSAAGLGTSPRGLSGCEIPGYPGDTNGDGLTDVVAAEDAMTGADGCVFFGRGAGPSAAPDVSLTNVGLASSGGDLDADGYDDVVTPGDPTRPAHLYRGGAAGPSTTGTNDFGGLRYTALDAAGDVNRDGYADAVFGLRTGTQRVDVYQGAAGPFPNTATRALVSPIGLGEGFGFSVARASCWGAGVVEAHASPWCEASHAG